MRTIDSAGRCWHFDLCPLGIGIEDYGAVSDNSAEICRLGSIHLHTFTCDLASFLLMPCGHAYRLVYCGRPPAPVPVPVQLPVAAFVLTSLADFRNLQGKWPK